MNTEQLIACGQDLYETREALERLEGVHHQALGSVIAQKSADLDALRAFSQLLLDLVTKYAIAPMMEPSNLERIEDLVVDGTNAINHASAMAYACFFCLNGPSAMAILGNAVVDAWGHSEHGYRDSNAVALIKADPHMIIVFMCMLLPGATTEVLNSLNEKLAD